MRISCATLWRGSMTYKPNQLSGWTSLVIGTLFWLLLYMMVLHHSPKDSSAVVLLAFAIAFVFTFAGVAGITTKFTITDDSIIQTNCLGETKLIYAELSSLQFIKTGKYGTGRALVIRGDHGRIIIDATMENFTGINEIIRKNAVNLVEDVDKVNDR